MTYRFIIAAFAMACYRAGQGRGAAPAASAAWSPPSLLGFTQFCVNFNAVYLAERHITSGVVATVFALLLIPSSLLGWAFLGQQADAALLLGLAGRGRGHRPAVRP